jgi:hypothetical protein
VAAGAGAGVISTTAIVGGLAAAGVVASVVANQNSTTQSTPSSTPSAN